MQKPLLAVLALILFISITPAQQKLEAPKPKTDRKVFLVGVSLLAASKTVDAITTSRILDLPGNRGIEVNPLFGPHQSPAKQSLINLGIFGAQAGLLYAGLVEREFPLFRYTEANPQGEMTRQ